MNPVDIKYLLDAINASKYKPNSKESGLLKTMEEHVRDGRYASPGQAGWLQEIYRKSQDNNGHQWRERS